MPAEPTLSRARPYPFRLIASTLLVAIGIGAIPSSVQHALAATYTSPKALVLHTRDIPPSLGSGFAEAGTVVTNDDVAAVEGVSTATISQHGRITGYQTAFIRRVPSAINGITDSVGAYSSVAGAHWQYKEFLSVFPVPGGSTMMSMHGVGNEARAYIQTTSFGAHTVSRAQVYFRRGIYNARIDVSALRALHAGDVLALSRTLDGRLRRARNG